MEISKSLQVDIRNIQNQLKAAIQNHQVMVLKQRSDPSNIQIKKDIGEVQKYIISLGESQKHVIQRLRKELEANSTNSTLAAKNVSLSLGFGVANKPKSKLHTALNNNNINNNNNNNNNNGNSYTKGKDATSNEKGPHPIHKPNCVQQLSRTSPMASEDSQRLKETPCDPNMADKVSFLSAVGLVTREVLSELQNRRVERKRRSTANHTQFVYGNNWDVSVKKRKKNSYLVSGSTPTTHVTRSQRMVETQASSSPAPPPPLPLPCPPASSTLVSQDSGTLCIPGLPSTLTIERVSSPPRACVVCHKTGALTECNSCNVSLHPICVEDWPRCPQCGVKQESMAVLQTYVTEHKPDLTERNAERLRLQLLNTQLTTEKEAMELRASELTVSLATQATQKKEILRMEDTVRKRIQTIQDFVNLIKSPRSVIPS